MEMIPYAGKRPSPQQTLESADMYEGVVILVPDEYLQEILNKIEAWFDDRDDIIFIENGQAAKNELGFIILEWESVKIDPLFLKILDDEEKIFDYMVYGRETDL